MKYTKKVDYITIHANVKITKEMYSPVKEGIRKTKKFFKKHPKNVNLFICNTEEEFKQQLGSYYKDWATAWVNPNTDINIKSPRLIEQIGRWKRKDFGPILAHEINHASYRHNIGVWHPNWLVEGLAIYVSKNFETKTEELKKIIKKYKVDEKIVEFRYMRTRKTGLLPRYPVWEQFTRYIIKKHGEEKIKKLLEALSKNASRANYDKHFKKLFRYKDKTIFKHFMRSLKWK